MSSSTNPMDNETSISTTGTTSMKTGMTNATTTTLTLTERLQQARNHRRSLGTSCNSNHKPQLATTSTTDITSSSPANPTVIATKSSLESNDSHGSTTNNNNNHHHNTISQRYRTLPGFVSSSSSSLSSSTSPTPPLSATTTAANTTTTSSTTTTMASPATTTKSVSLGRYRPSTSNSSNIGSKSPLTSAATPTTATTKGTTNATPVSSNPTISSSTSTTTAPRTWRNIHELVQKMEVQDTTTTTSTTSTTHHPTPSTSTSNAPTTGTQYPSWKYRNLHNTLATMEKEEPAVTTKSTTGSSTKTTEPPLPITATNTTSPEPVMNRWKYKYNTIHTDKNHPNGGKVDGSNHNNNSNENHQSTTTKMKPYPMMETTVSAPPATLRKVVAAPHSYVPAPQQQYTFVSSPTNGSTSTNGLKKKNYVSTVGGDETSTLSLGTSHSFGSTQSSLSQTPIVTVVPPPPSSSSSQSSPTATLPYSLRTTTGPSSTILHSNAAAASTTTTTTTSPTSLTVSPSRSFGSQSSISKHPSTDAAMGASAISTVSSWKSTKKPDTKSTTAGPVVYGSPVPAWKKKLLEQQRLQQQQQQEKAAQAIPKWKRKQLEQKQQQQPEKDSVVVVAADTTGGTDHLVSSPSDERPDNHDGIATAVDHVIATALSNVAVVMEGTTTSTEPITTTTTVIPTTSTKTKWSSPPSSSSSSNHPTKESVGRPRLRLGASPETDTFGTTRGGADSTVSSKTWFSKNGSSKESATIRRMGNHNENSDIVGVPSEETVTIPSPDKDDPAIQSGIGESTSLLSPHRRGDIVIQTTVDTTSVHDESMGRSVKQWESPRTARLEAMKANTNNSTPHSAFSRPGPVGKASPVVVVPNHLLPSPGTTTKKWQPPPKKETPKANIIPIVHDVAEESKERVETRTPATETLVESNEALSKKSSVAEMKAKLWGTGKTEKLVVAPKDVSPIPPAGESKSYSTNPTMLSNASNSFGSPIRSNSNNERVISTTTPPKPNSATFKSIGSLSSEPHNTRGRPDVCTPNGPLPPQRSGSSRVGDQQLPPRRNLDRLWLNRLEQTNPDHVVTPGEIQRDDNTQRAQSGVTSDAFENDGGVGKAENGGKEVYSESTKDYVEALQNDPVLPPPPPPAERSSHYRSPSIGDFQVAANQSVKEIVEDVSNEFVTSPPVSPRVSRPADPISPTIRPAVMARWDDFPLPPKSDSISPTSRRLLPPKLPPTSPVATEKKDGKTNFSEMIDCPPLDDSEKWGTDADITGPKELVDSIPHPLSPRSKQDRPWTKDANTLSPSTWMKPKADPPIETEISTPIRPPRSDPPSNDERIGDEKKSSEDVLAQAQSPSSLMRMAADSIHAVDYEKVVQGLQRRSILDEDDDSLLSAATPGSAIPTVVPPEFEKAISDTEGNDPRAHVPAFGHPIGAVEGEAVAEVPVSVADRAKALASWNGGLGAPTTAPGLPDCEIAPTLSPIRREESESEMEGMSPRISKRGFGLDDWKRAKSFDSKAEFETSSDFWQPSNLDNQSQVDEKDWSRCDPDVDGANLSQSDSLNKDTFAPAPTPVSSNHETKRSTPPLLQKSKMDTESRPKMTWKKKPLVPKPDGTSAPPRPMPKLGPLKTRKSDIGTVPAPLLSGQSSQNQSTSKNENLNTFDPFDPFEFSFNNESDKVEFTEVTEFSDGTDFFSASDPFIMNPSSFPKLQEQIHPTSAKTTVEPPSNDDDYDDGDADVEYEDEYLYDGEYPPTLSGLNPPSGSNLSQYEVWSYDADTSNLQDGAAEI